MKYSVSFTAGSLLLDETNRILKYILNDELELKKEEIIKKNIIKINSESARKRVLQEIRLRARKVNKSLWGKFANASLKDKKILLFYVVVKTYPILSDFVKDVIIDKWKSLKLDIADREIEVFLDKKSSEHPEIEDWSESTREKVIQVIKRIMKEAGLLVNNQLKPLESADHFWKFFVQLGDPWFLDYALLNREQRERIIGKL